MRRECKIYLSEEDLMAFERVANILREIDLARNSLGETMPTRSDLAAIGNEDSYSKEDGHFCKKHLDNIYSDDLAKVLFLDKQEV